jgi:hypothetical protein
MKQIKKKFLWFKCGLSFQGQRPFIQVRNFKENIEMNNELDSVDFFLSYIAYFCNTKGRTELA